MIMAAPIVIEEIVYGAVSNIPIKLHSKDLRNYFSQFLEVGGFDCFHFKHRPERTIAENREIDVDKNDLETSHSASSAPPPHPPHQQHDHDHQALCTDAIGTVSQLSESPRVTRNFDEDEEEGFPRQPLEGIKNPEYTESRKQINKRQLGNQIAASKTTCCIIRLCESNMNKLVKMYNKRNWVDDKGNMIPQLCHISKIKVASIDKGFLPVVNLEFQGKKKRLEAQNTSESILRMDLMKLPELNPPDIMPNGNVGTPTSVFNELIRSCRLPPKVIKRLGIVFPKSRTNKRYGNVPLQYSGEVLPGEEKEESVVTASGHEIFKTNGKAALAPGTSSSRIQKENSKKEHRKRQRKQMSSEGDHDEPWPESEREDDDSGEEWDRHETLHNDVTNQERTTERLFENEIEVTWDKGSSGLVFYTDAAYWDKHEGDFDEKTSDDWDIDMSAYYDSHGGDKDARDFLQMRRERGWKLGLESTSVFKSKTQIRKEKRQRMQLARKGNEQDRTIQDTSEEDQGKAIGEFEKHTKGFGRKLMEAQGWVEGEGLGKTVKGMSQALDSIGQKTHDKRGFGYFGKKLKPMQQSKISHKQRQSAHREVIISTVYDDPKVTDPPEPLLRSQGPYHLKYRDKVQFTKASDGDVNSAE